jgi:hypothetical protein
MLAWVLAAAAQEPVKATWERPARLRTCPVTERALPGDLAHIIAAVVVVRQEEGVGSGVLVSPDGFVLTAAHVIEGASRVEVTLDQGSTLPAQVVRVDKDHDVALLHIPGVEHPCLVGGGAPAVGTEVYAIGSPLHHELGASVTRGVVSGVRTVAGERLIQTDASINPGNSGGPLVDLSGRVVGIVQFKLLGEAVEGLGFGMLWEQVAAELALEWAEASDPDLQGLARRFSPVVPGAETIDTPVVDSEIGVHDTYRPRFYQPLDPTAVPKELDEPLMAGGAAVAAVGWLLVGGTTVWYLTNPEATPASWSMAQGVNAVGWIGALSGSGMIVAGTLSWKLP